MLHHRHLFLSPRSLSAELVPSLRPSALVSCRQRAYTVAEAYEYCQRLAATRRERPLNTRLLPSVQRLHVAALYAFVAAAEGLGVAPASGDSDEPRDARALLDWWEDELYRAFQGDAEHPIFIALRDTAEHNQLPITPFCALLTAARGLGAAPSYATLAELRLYCSYRYEPLAQLLLQICGYRDPAALAYGSYLSTGLQFTAFLQDLSVDLAAGQLYLPLEDLHFFGIPAEALKAPNFQPLPTGDLPRTLRDLILFETAQAKAFLQRGRPLLDRLADDLHMELALAWHSAWTLLDKIEDYGAAVVYQQPALRRGDQVRILARAAPRRWAEVVAAF